MKTKYDTLGNFLNEARTDGAYWEEDTATEGTPEWIIAQTLGLIADVKALAEALYLAEAALADIGDADREPGDDVAWCEQRAAQALPAARAALARIQGEAG